MAGMGSSAVLNTATNLMEIPIDTSALTGSPITFYVRAELEHNPSTFAYSNQLSVSVTCGSEVVSVSQTDLELAVQPRDQGEAIDLTFAGLGLDRIFSSSSSQCDISLYEAFTTQLLDEPWTDSSIQLKDGDAPATTSFRMDRSTPAKAIFYLKASTPSGASNFVRMTQVICGNEIVRPLSAASFKEVLHPGDAYSISKEA